MSNDLTNGFEFNYFRSITRLSNIERSRIGQEIKFIPMRELFPGIVRKNPGQNEGVE